MALALGLSTLQRLSASALDMSLSRALCGLTLTGRRDVSTSAPAAIAVTHTLWAEPLKKKKRIDPAVVRAREERRRRKLEKAIRRLEKSSRQLKPLAELELPRNVRAELKERRRPAQTLTTEQADQRFDMMKAWTRYKRQQHVGDVAMFRRIQESRAKALQELRAESFELYCAAIAEDPELVPFSHRGPTLTPPIADYDAPDGDYVDTTRQWE